MIRPGLNKKPFEIFPTGDRSTSSSNASSTAGIPLPQAHPPIAAIIVRSHLDELYSQQESRGSSESIDLDYTRTSTPSAGAPDPSPVLVASLLPTLDQARQPPPSAEPGEQADSLLPTLHATPPIDSASVPYVSPQPEVCYCLHQCGSEAHIDDVSSLGTTSPGGAPWACADADVFSNGGTKMKFGEHNDSHLAQLPHVARGFVKLWKEAGNSKLQAQFTLADGSPRHFLGHFNPAVEEFECHDATLTYSNLEALTASHKFHGKLGTTTIFIALEGADGPIFEGQLVRPLSPASRVVGFGSWFENITGNLRSVQFHPQL